MPFDFNTWISASIQAEANNQIDRARSDLENKIAQGLSEIHSRINASPFASFATTALNMAQLHSRNPTEVRGRMLDALQRGDPLFNFDFRVEMAIGDFVFESKYVEGVTLPAMTNTVDSVYRSGSKTYLSLDDDVGNVVVKLYEDQALTASRFLRYWRGLIRKPDGSHGLPADYWGYMEVCPLSHKGQPLAFYKLKHVFPTGYPTVTYDVGESGRIVLEAEFAVNSMRIELPNEGKRDASHWKV